MKSSILNISGKWNLKLGNYEKGLKFNDTIKLPSTLSVEKKAPINNNEITTKNLTDPYEYSGSAVFSREVKIKEIPQHLYLKLERTRMTKVYVNDAFVGSGDSLCTSQLFDLTDFVTDTKFILTIEVSNINYPAGGGHLASPDTQTNWLGILGEMSIISKGKIQLNNLKITGDIHNKRARISIDAKSDFNGVAHFTFEAKGEGVDEKQILAVALKKGDNKVCYTLGLGKNPPLWEEENPNLLNLKVTAESGKELDEISSVFGLREFKNEDGHFSINGKKTFLRGKHDGMIFPLTGHAPMDVDGWLKVMKKSMEYGINHYRFHTCTPPDAAFQAADILGIYMSPELPLWHGVLVMPGDKDNYRAACEDWIVKEGYRIFKEFGNHPSFVMFSLGNELTGNRDRINALVSEYQEFDNRRLYTEGSNNYFADPFVLPCDDYFSGVRFSKNRKFRASFAMIDHPQGHVQEMVPNSSFTYDRAIHPDKDYPYADENPYNDPIVPVVSHEIGQYVTYPNYEVELPCYTGVLKPGNLEIFRKRLIDAGLGHREKSIHETSGALAVENYKSELESALRSKSMSGFQILDLQDFLGQGTACIGVLDVFMNPKDTVSAERWREFCSNAVIMACLDKFVFNSNEQIDISFCAALYRELPSSAKLTLQIDGKKVYSTDVNIERGLNQLGKTSVKYTSKAIEKKEIQVSLIGDGLDIVNHYNIWITPNEKAAQSKKVTIAHTKAELDVLLDGDNRVLFIPSEKTNSVKGDYATDFWCYPMFRDPDGKHPENEPAGTLGLNIDTSSKLFANFYKDFENYTTPIWYNTIKKSNSVILDKTGIEPIVAVNDNFDIDRNHNLGLIYEFKCNNAKVLVCASDIENPVDGAEKWLYNQCIKYVEKFEPNVEISKETALKIFKKKG